MARQSDYHGWDIPEIDDDEDQWGTLLNNTLADGSPTDDFLRSIDDEVILKDSIDNRPPADSEGRWFMDTDDLDLYYDNGNSWNLITSGGGFSEDFSELPLHMSEQDPQISFYDSDILRSRIRYRATGIEVDLDTDDTSSSEAFSITHDDNAEALFSVHEDGTVSVEQGPFEVPGDSSDGTVEADGSFGIDIDNNANQTAATFDVTHDDFSETLFSVHEDANVEIPAGPLVLSDRLSGFQTQIEAPSDIVARIGTIGGTGSFRLVNDATNENLLYIPDSGDAMFPNGDLTVDGIVRTNGMPAGNMRSITHTFPETQLDGASEEEMVHRQYVPDGRTLRIYAWGCTREDGSTPGGLSVRVRRQDGDDQAYESTSHSDNVTGMHEWQSNGEVFIFAVKNQTGADVEASGFINAVIE